MKTIVLYPMNGIGLGHLQRISVLAASLRSKKTRIILVTNSPVPGIFGKFYDHCIKLPYFSPEILGDNKKYDEVMTANSGKFVQIVKKYKPDLIIGDFSVYANFLFIPFRNAIDAWPAKTIYLWEPGERAEFFERWDKVQGKLKYFDKIVFLYEQREFKDIMPSAFVKKISQDKKYFFGAPLCQTADKKSVITCRRKYDIGRDDFLIVVALGGGGGLDELGCEFPDKIIDTFLTIYPSLRRQIPNLKVFISTGPFYKKGSRFKAKFPGIKTVAFEKNFQAVMASAKLVITAAGYSTCNEIILEKTPAILIPLLRANRRQFERAAYLKKMGVAETISNLTQPILLNKIMACRKNLDIMKKNFVNFSNFKPGNKKIAALAHKMII